MYSTGGGGRFISFHPVLGYSAVTLFLLTGKGTGSATFWGLKGRRGAYVGNRGRVLPWLEKRVLVRFRFAQTCEGRGCWKPGEGKRRSTFFGVQVGGMEIWKMGDKAKCNYMHLWVGCCMLVHN